MNGNAALAFEPIPPLPTKKSKPRKYQFTPFQDELIRRLYREKYSPREGKVSELADVFGFPRWLLSRGAYDLGVYEPKIKEPPWSPSELHILELNACLTPRRIQVKLKISGYKRSIVGIMLKLKRMKFRQQQIRYTACSLAQCFGSEVHAVLRWIKKGWLKAVRRGTDRTPAQGGDEWLIKEKDIRQFIIENIGIIDIRKVDKFWFVDMMTKGKEVCL